MTYTPDQTRRILKTEQSEYVKQAIEKARTAPASHEGSLNPSQRTFFVFTNMHAALERFAALSAEGWTLDHSAPALAVGQFTPLGFTAVAPEEVFETYMPVIAARAESAYAKEVEAHNKQAVKIKERETFIESEFQRLEQVRLAALRAEIASRYDSPTAFHNTNGDAVKLHA